MDLLEKSTIIKKFVLYTDRVCARDLESMREVVECVGPGTDGVLGPRHLGEEPGAAVHAQLADVHVRLRRAHRTTLGHTLHFILHTQNNCRASHNLLVKSNSIIMLLKTTVVYQK